MAEPSSVVVEGERVLVPGTLVANNYRVKGQLGAGGMGTVFLGENVTLRQDVVVKVLRVGGLGAGAEEARVLASLDHPNVVHVYAYDERWDCIVMQRLQGRSLQDAAFPPPGSKDARLDPISCIRVIAQTAQALSAVHERGMVHRDVKPDNVMLDFTGGEVKWVKLIDFGLALRVGRTVAAPAGTPEFCSPEQFDASAPAHPANDVYALGVSLFYLLTGCYPFDGTPQELAQAHRSAPPPDLLETLSHRLTAPLDPHLGFVFEKVGELIDRALEKEPAARPSARELSFALTELLDRFSSENTQVGRSVLAPVPLTELAPRVVSTMVLGGREAASTAEALALSQPARGRRMVAVLGGLLVLALGWALWARSTTDAPTPSAEPSPAPELPSVKPPPAAEVEALVPLPPVPVPQPDAGAPALVVAPPRPVKIVAVIETPACTPTEAWRKGALAQLADLGGMASKKSVSVGVWFDGEEQRVSEQLRAASTPSECAAVEAALTRLQREIERK